MDLHLQSRPPFWFELTSAQQAEWQRCVQQFGRHVHDLEVQLQHAKEDAARAAAAAERQLRSLRSDLQAAEEEISVLMAAQIKDRKELQDLKQSKH